MTSVLADNYQLSFALCLIFILLVPFAIAGLVVINTGLGRSRSAAHYMTSSLCVMAIAMLVYFAWGYQVQGSPETHDSLSGFTRGLGNPGLFFNHLGSGFRLAPAFLAVLSVALASLISLGAAADRWRIAAGCASSLAFAGWIYPSFLRLAQIGFAGPLVSRTTIGGNFLDAGGSGFINVTGGLTALAITWLLGPRRGKYSPNGMPAAIPAHNAVYVLFGCMLAWVGWLGLNSAGAILYASSPPERSVLVIINTTFCAAAAGLTAAAVTRIRFRRPDASLIANGWMAGLVASSAGCAILKPATAILTGLVAGALVVFSVEFFEFTLKVDDPCGSISVHAVCGIWGLLAAGIFAGSSGQLMAQIVGVATLLGFIFPMAYGLNWVLNKIIPYRVLPDGERQGLDLHELGADAYPEFVVHADEFMQR
jgi:ammonium transporter, Amt family